MGTSSIDSSTSDPFSILGQDTSATRSQLAQYAVVQAATFMQKGENLQAIGSFKKALALDPQNTTAYNYLGQIYMSQGKNADAIKAFQQLVRVQSNPNTANYSSNAPTLVDAHVSLANAYLQDKQYSKSEQEYKTAAKLDPGSPLADYTLGQQYMQTNRLSEAEAQFKKVQKISPNDGNVYYALGQLYNKQGNYAEAAKDLEKSLTLKKNFAAANYELGVAYNGLGRTDDAKRQLSILQSSDTGLASQLKFILNKPQMISRDTTKNTSFIDMLGPGTPLWYLDPSLSVPNSSKTFAVTIMFNNDMDVSAVTNSQNWAITRANSTEAGYYNNMMPVSSKDVTIPQSPLSITYDSTTREATINFRISQNATGDAVIDPSHIVFTYTGTDAAGRKMDSTANAIDGANPIPF